MLNTPLLSAVTGKDDVNVKENWRSVLSGNLLKFKILLSAVFGPSSYFPYLSVFLNPSSL